MGESWSTSSYQRVEFVLGIDVGSASISGGSQPVDGRDLNVDANGLAVAGQAPDRGETLALIGVLQTAISLRPGQGLRGRESSTGIALAPKPFEEASRVTFLLDQCEPQRAAAKQVVLQTGQQVDIDDSGAHCYRPHEGVSDRSGAMSTRAYVIDEVSFE